MVPRRRRALRFAACTRPAHVFFTQEIHMLSAFLLFVCVALLCALAIALPVAIAWHIAKAIVSLINIGGVQ